MHPLQGGLFRRKCRLDRRYGMPIEPIWTFYPKLIWEVTSKHVRMIRNWLMIDRMRRRVRGPDRHHYSDSSLAPVTDQETETLELFTHNESARHEVEHQRRVAELTHGSRSLVDSPT